ncbi:uncharacterized protein LOC144705344 isoform X2 [Wolffia australiana]
MAVAPAGFSCPSNSFVYNNSVCACNPGYYLSEGRSCSLLREKSDLKDWIVHEGVESSPTFFTTVFSLDSIKRFTKSQAIILEGTLVLLVAWLLYCIFLRILGRRKTGKDVWFRLRWVVSRFDFFYSMSHWSDENKAVVRRKTELGGTLSVASFIVFIGLLSALLYQVIAKRTIEIHKIRPANAPDLIPFVNDMEFNITTISGMSCSHLRGLDTLVSGIPNLDYRTVRISTYANYSCQNTSKGPTISLKCNSCRVPRESFSISWQFVDLPNDPALAVGFEFNLTTKSRADNKRLSYVSGVVDSGDYTKSAPKTFRGKDSNVFKIHLFPQVYIYLHSLPVIQPLLHEFIPGSSFSEAKELQNSLQVSSIDGFINTTLYIRFLSDYIVEIDKQSILGPVGFLADIGGLYAISIAIFMCILFQCEYRIKSLRNEDAAMRAIRNRRRAQLNWNKVRKYVAYTWCPSNMDVASLSDKKSRSSGRLVDSLRRKGILRFPKRLAVRKDSFYLTELGISPGEKTVVDPGESSPVTVSGLEICQNEDQRTPRM